MEGLVPAGSLPRTLLMALLTSTAAGSSPFSYSNSAVTMDMPAMLVELTWRIRAREESSISMGLLTVAATTLGVPPGTWVMTTTVGRSESGKRFLGITTSP